MDLKEFAALKPGDRIDNHMSGGHGRIIEAAERGVHVAWGEETRVTFFYNVAGTAWMHWSKAE
jgi:preprotein translocase subunit YajC